MTSSVHGVRQRAMWAKSAITRFGDQKIVNGRFSDVDSLYKARDHINQAIEKLESRVDD